MYCLHVVRSSAVGSAETGRDLTSTERGENVGVRPHAKDFIA